MKSRSHLFDAHFAESIKSWAPHLTDTQRIELAALINPRTVKAKRLVCPANQHFGCTFPFTNGSLNVLQDIAQLNSPLVLDVACGFGSFAQLAAIAGANVIGVDINSAALAQASANINKFKPYTQGKIKFIQADVLALRDKVFQTKYDVIHCRKFMHFLPPSLYPQMIDNLYGALRPGGVLYICANSIHSGDPARRALAEQRFDQGEPHPGYLAFSRLDHTIKAKAIPADINYEPGVLYRGPADAPQAVDIENYDNKESLIYMTNMLDHRSFQHYLINAGILPANIELYYESWNIYAPELLPAPTAVIKADTPYNLFARIVKN